MWLLPSENRPRNLLRFFEAYHATGATTPGVVLVSRDDYERNRLAYGEVRLALPLGWHLESTRGITQGDKLREVWADYAGAWAGPGGWVGLIGDDNVPVTHRWDAKLLEALERWGIVSCNDLWQAPKRLANCWIMSGEMVRRVGYIFPPGLQHLYVDDVWETIGRDCGNWRCLLDVTVRHAHVLKGEAPADETHRAVYGSDTVDHRAGLWPNDRAVYEQWAEGERHGVVAMVREHYRPAPPAVEIVKTSESYKTDKPDDPRIARLLERKVFIATPTYRDPVLAYTVSLIHTVLRLDRMGIKHDEVWRVGGSNLPRSRNELTAQFLASDYTDLLFIDADMGWDANDVLRLIASPQGVIGGVGRKRTDTPNDEDMWCVKFIPGSQHALEQDEMGAVRVRSIGTGFLKITREALEQTIAHHPHLKARGRGVTERERPFYYRLFQFGMEDDPADEMGEDYVFCLRYGAAGGTVWADPRITLKHIGEKEFTGNFAESLLVAQPKDAAA